MTDELLSAADIDGKPMIFTEASNVPSDADPDASGAVDMPIGFHLVKLIDYGVALHHEFKWKQETYIAHQLRPKLEIAEGQPCAGARCSDFLPCPMQGQTVAVDMMNLWYNFLRAFGFTVPKGASAPANFHTKQLIGAQAVVEIVNQTDRDGTVKTHPDGRIRTGVRFFGYHPVSKLADLQKRNSANGTPAPGKMAAKPAQAAAFSL